MNEHWQEFLRTLNDLSLSEYGDFKREVDHHLRRMIETSPPMTHNQAHEIAKLRDEYLWHDHEDSEIEPMKRHLLKRMEEIALIH